MYRKSELKEVLAVQPVRVSYPYSEENTVTPLIQTFRLFNQSSQYTEKVSILFACKVEQAQGFLTALEKPEYRGIEFEKLGESFL